MTASRIAKSFASAADLAAFEAAHDLEALTLTEVEGRLMVLLAPRTVDDPQITGEFDSWDALVAFEEARGLIATTWAEAEGKVFATFAPLESEDDRRLPPPDEDTEDD